MAFALEGPTLIEVEQGKSRTAIIRVLATSRPYRNVSLRITGLPSGITAGFSPSSGKPTFSSTLTIQAGLSSATGTFTLTITARDAKGSKTMPVVFRNYTVNIPPPPPASGNERLGLHVTADELAIWRDRAVNGPYKTDGDQQTNSPGDWTRISDNAETFRGAPTAGIWNTPTAPYSTTQQAPPMTQVRLMRDGAFKALINQDTDLKNKVRDWILSQYLQSEMDFNNRTKWAEASLAADTLFTTSEWLICVLYAMDYIEILDSSVFNASQRTGVLNWFNGYADLAMDSSIINLAGFFQDRMNDDYTIIQAEQRAGGIVYFNGPEQTIYGRRWNNRHVISQQAVTEIGVKLNNATYKAYGVRYGKEIVRYAIHPTENANVPSAFVTDFHRMTDSPETADRGWSYACSIIGSLVSIADVLARAGDPSVYAYTTSDGAYDSVGGSKNVLYGVKTLLQYDEHVLQEYGTTIAGNNGNPNYLIDEKRDDAEGKSYLNWLYFIHANLYYQDSFVSGSIRRTNAGSPPLPTAANRLNGTLDFQGRAGTYPGMLFMFGLLEGVVDPYP